MKCLHCDREFISLDDDIYCSEKCEDLAKADKEIQEELNLR